MSFDYDFSDTSDNFDLCDTGSGDDCDEDSDCGENSLTLIFDDEGRASIYRPYATFDILSEEDFEFFHECVNRRSFLEPLDAEGVRICPVCKTPLTDDTLFCRICGQCLSNDVPKWEFNYDLRKNPVEEDA